jgi:hypothetical protein
VARRTNNRLWLPSLICLPILAAAALPVLAAPILGQNQEGGVTQPPATPIIRPTELDPRATVIQFSVLPSPANPDRFETTIIVQQDGGRQVCVNHKSPAIIVRSYQTDADPFAPDIPTNITGQDSGDVGELAGFNSKKVFIRPRESDDRFDLPEEPFAVGQFGGVFTQDEIECDQELTEGDFACLVEVIRTSDCDLREHADLMRELRIMLALNSIPLIAPAAGGPLNGLARQGIGPDTGDGVIARRPRFTGAAPGFSASFGSSGADGLLLVPDLVGLPISTARSLVISSGFTLGPVTEKSSSNASLFDGLIIGTAHAAIPDPPVVDQIPPGGTRAPAGTPINLTVQISAVAVPEPSSLSIFIVGLLLISGFYWFSAGRSRQRRAQA